MPVVSIPPFMFLVEFNEDLFVVPRLNSDVSCWKSLKLLALFVFLIGWILLEILHENAGDLLGPLLHSLDVKIDFRSDLVFGEFILFRGIGIDIVDGTAVAASDDDPFASLFLDIVE